MTDSSIDRRKFLRATTAATAATALMATKPVRANAINDRLRIGLIGTGRRGFGTHVKTLATLHKQGAKIDMAAVCDVYTVHRDQAVEHLKNETGLSPRVYGDYRDMLAAKDIDAVFIATPDHWHARQAIDALCAGKHVYCEKPMTHTVEESLDVLKAWKESGLVMQVGVQGTSMPIWDRAREMIEAGKLGKIVQFQTECARNSLAGMSRHNIITKEMTPKTIDWRRWLGVDEGLAPEMDFDRATFGQWRCYWPFSNGMYGDLFVHRITAMLKATGLRFPSRVVGGGGIFLEYDDRQVPDVATVVADFEEGAQALISSTMVSQNVPMRQLIRGHHGLILFDEAVWSRKQAFEYIPERPQVTLDSSLKKESIVDQRTPNQNIVHFSNFIEAIEKGDPSLANNQPDLGAAAVTLVNLAVRSYREGKVFHVDSKTGQPSEADASWAAGWEKMSQAKAKPRHVPGWKGGDRGSLLEPFEYQQLAGPWINGRPPEKS